jgi:photosystem II stability/assembly factor-like uncharacterized protein
MKKVMLLIGTRKGAFLALSDSDRKRWDLRGPYFKGSHVNHLNYVGGNLNAVCSTVKNEWWGPDVRISKDLGESWIEPTQGVRFEKERELSVERIWVLDGDTRSAQPVLYAGVDPGALFESRDGGQNWTEVRSLTEHPTRDQWQPGAGGMMVHSLCFDPGNPSRMFVGISAAGVFRTDDGGKSWSPKNKGVRADFLPNKRPEVGQCTHHLEIHPANPSILYQQNHCGVYRSENGGDEWIDISEGLPSRFGFPLAVHPHDGDTIYVCPEESDQYRMSPGGAFRIYRSRNRGQSWEALTDGLPQSHAYQLVLRAAMATDSLDPAGIYVGTQGGQLLGSRDEGDHWEVLFNWLPPVYSVKTTWLEA